MVNSFPAKSHFLPAADSSPKNLAFMYTGATLHQIRAPPPCMDS